MLEFIAGLNIYTFLLMIVLLIVGLIALISSIFVVDQNTVRLIETFGKFSRTAGAGLNFKLPWPFQTVTDSFSLRIKEISEDVTVKSKDNAFVSIPIRVQYQVNENKAGDAFYTLDDPAGQIQSYVLNEVRSTATGLTFEELFQSRDKFEQDVAETLSERMTSFGFVIVNVLVDDPQPSKELRESFDRVLASQREREAAENQGAAERTLAVAKAQAEGESLEIKGKAWSNFRKTIADGNAEAIKSFTGETGMSPDRALDFFTSVNEMEAVRDAAESGGRTVFVAGSAAGKSGDPALLGLTAGAGMDTTHAAGPRLEKSGTPRPAYGSEERPYDVGET